MPTFKKRTNGVGVFNTADGVANVTPERIKHWHETIQALVKRGYRPPVCWGHQSGATPHSEDDDQYWRARFNAGRITGSSIDPKTGELEIEFDAAGLELTPDGALTSLATLPTGQTVRTQIDEVSIGAMDWKDGSGKVWKDAPIHLALTTLPVWVPEGGQPPFQAFGTKSLQLRFSTTTARSKPVENTEIKKVIDVLAKCGIALPPDTTNENLLDRLYVAATAVAGQQGGLGTDPDPASVEAPMDQFGTRIDRRFATAADRNEHFRKVADEMARAARLPARR